jgi:hypothetical protein
MLVVPTARMAQPALPDLQIVKIEGDPTERTRAFTCFVCARTLFSAAGALCG